MKISKYILFGLILIVMLGGAWYTGFKYNFQKNYVTESKTAIMNKMEKVFKLVTVEGHISEIYSYKDYYYYDISPFRKKAIIRVNAKASVGYDLAGLNINVDELNGVITIDSLPDPKLLSIEHDLEYYDLDEGSFNGFSEAELTKLNQAAKKYARQKAEESELFVKAEEQKGDIFSMLDVIAHSAGYSLEIKHTSSDILN